MSLAERDRTGADLILFSTLLSTGALAVSVPGSLALALAVLSLAVALPLVTRERTLRFHFGGRPIVPKPVDTRALVVGALLLTLCSCAQERRDQPLAKDGVIDLSD